MNHEKDITKLVDQIKQANNILVALSSNPSIDELTSALGLTLMLNKNNRRALAIFSGKIPKVIEFLKPSETFDTNADGLRDFIVTLDSKKADRVVMKAEDDLVKVFITPSGTTISSDDLGFSQGDYNVDLVIALGVTKREGLDRALAAHGRILHNAAVTSIMIGNKVSDLGSLNIRAPKASSYAEIIAQLPQMLDRDLPEGDEAAMDGAVATALLTGLVAVTGRFSNTKTTAEIMSLASELMKAGANQQLVANELAKGKSSSEANLATKEESKSDQVDEVSVRPDKPSSKGSNVINLKNKTKKAPPKPQSEKVSSETQLEPVKTPEVKVEPGFTNLEEYNQQQLEVERQKVAEDVMTKLEEESSKEEPLTETTSSEPTAVSTTADTSTELPAVSIPETKSATEQPVDSISEDDRLAQELQQVSQVDEIGAPVEAEDQAASPQSVATPDSAIVFGKEISKPEQPYLQDGPSTAWGQAVNSAEIQAPAAAIVDSAPLLAPTSEAPAVPSSEPQEVAPESVSAPVSAETPVDLPPIPDFASLNIPPPVPPTPPNFAMPAPPTPPNPTDFAQPIAEHEPLPNFAPPADTAVAAPSVADQEVQLPPVDDVVPQPVPGSGPVLTDQVYPQTPENAQFVIPE